MTERMIGLDSAVAVAVAPVVASVKPKSVEMPARVAEKTLGICVSDGRDWIPVVLPEGADVALLKRLSGARQVHEMQYDTVINKYVQRESGPLKELYVYELFPVDQKQFAHFIAEYGKHK